MSDLESSAAIVFKGVLFFLLLALSGSLLVLRTPDYRTVVLVLVLVWSSARFYYFLFYVLERYVDPSLKYSGILSLAKALRSRRSSRSHSEPKSL